MYAFATAGPSLDTAGFNVCPRHSLSSVAHKFGYSWSKESQYLVNKGSHYDKDILACKKEACWEMEIVLSLDISQHSLSAHCGPSFLSNESFHIPGFPKTGLRQQSVFLKYRPLKPELLNSLFPDSLLSVINLYASSVHLFTVCFRRLEYQTFRGCMSMSPGELKDKRATWTPPWGLGFLTCKSPPR